MKEKLSKHDINKDIHDHLNEIMKEFRVGFDDLKRHPKSVSILGSTRLTPASSHYKAAEELAYRIAKELNYAVVTGGGPGIMAAANLGAKRGNGTSIGYTIRLSNVQLTNPYTTTTVDFDYFFVRKTILTFAAEAFVFFPGGFGTLDEFFDIITLVQTKKIPRVPIICIGKDYWNPLRKFIVENILEKHHAIDHDDLDLFTVTDNLDQTIEIIKQAPVSEWWKLNKDEM
jgi:uncharacterized protein (TIGR00730 family)